MLWCSMLAFIMHICMILSYLTTDRKVQSYLFTEPYSDSCLSWLKDRITTTIHATMCKWASASYVLEKLYRLSDLSCKSVALEKGTLSSTETTAWPWLILLYLWNKDLRFSFSCWTLKFWGWVCYFVRFLTSIPHPSLRQWPKYELAIL